MSTIHICVDARILKTGIGVYLQNGLSKLQESRNINTMALVKDTDEEDDIFKGRVSAKKFNFNIYTIKEQLGFREAIPKCNLFWSPHYNVPFFKIDAKHRVVTIHDVYHLHIFKQLSLLQKVYVKVAMKAATLLSDSIITVSDFSKNEIVKYTGCKPEKINVIYNGVNQKSHVKDFTAIQSEYGMPDNYLLFVGSVKPHKNLSKLLDAYLILNKSFQEKYKIVIVGKKDGFITADEGLFNIIQSNEVLKKSIVFTGYVKDVDMDTIYANASVFVFPSLYEGFGLPPLEAMKCNCPVAASDIPSVREICEDAVLYFNPDSSLEIKRAIEKILSNSMLREELIFKGLNQIKKFDWNVSANKHLELFEKYIKDV
ncbi:glycosyltransferase family 1 protein [Mucilaginibacter sp. PAMB04168]|uniref:glycosyltransferase family 4 protein n=1 Tax=Mucilaginibacter sp. PAMB04168 TaxID=3138567 RepID=UPI0031F69512